MRKRREKMHNYPWGDETHEANRKPARRATKKKVAAKKTGSSSTVEGAKERVRRKIYK